MEQVKVLGHVPFDGHIKVTTGLILTNLAWMMHRVTDALNNLGFRCRRRLIFLELVKVLEQGPFDDHTTILLVQTYIVFVFDSHTLSRQPS